MISSIELVSYTTAAALFLLLSLVLTTGRRGIPAKTLLAAAAFSTALWATSVAFRIEFQSPNLTATLLELVRDLFWFAFLLYMIATSHPQPKRVTRIARTAFAGLALIAAATLAVAVFRSDLEVAGHLLLALSGLVLIEQLYRNNPAERQRGLRCLCVAVGSMFAYDFYLYADALLVQQLDTTLWSSRGFAHAIAVPILLTALARRSLWGITGDWNDVYVSRRAAFHTTALLAAGIYLLIMGAGGYFVRIYGGSWGVVWQTIFLFGAIVMLAILLFSRQLRAKLRVVINKNFFHYKYDYREEWLRFIRNLSSGGLETQVRERAIMALAQIVESPGGILWMRTSCGRYQPIARWNMGARVPQSEPGDSPFVKFLEEREWVINLDEHRHISDTVQRTLPVPAWLTELPRAWLVVPLILHERLFGFVVLSRAQVSAIHTQFNWEDCDLLKIAGRQAASHLAQLESSRELAEGRQFEAFSKLSAFVVHDVKNLTSQLSMIVSNAATHKHNPLFVEDMIRTVDNSVARMNRLLGQLRGDDKQIAAAGEVDLADVLMEIAKPHGGNGPWVSLECDEVGVMVKANRDRLSAIVGHVVQNARDATGSEGTIRVRLRRSGDHAVVEVADTGCGMDQEFICERLFRPFDTTKGNNGMGIGAYETREYVRSLGGTVDVTSAPRQGTVFRLNIPICHTTAQQGIAAFPTNA